MAEVTKHSVKVRVETSILLVLDEEEARALDGIFGYSVEDFLRVFYEKMGKSYVQPFEGGVRKLHAKMRAVVAGPLAETDKARRLINDANELACEQIVKQQVPQKTKPRKRATLWSKPK